MIHNIIIINTTTQPPAINNSINALVPVIIAFIDLIANFILL